MPTYGLQFSGELELIRKGHDVDGLRRLREITDLPEYQPVLEAVEVLGADHFGDPVPGFGGDHQATEDGLLGFQGLGLELDPREFAVPFPGVFLRGRFAFGAGFGHQRTLPESGGSE